MGILIREYKDPYKPTSIMESRGFFSVAQVFVSFMEGIADDVQLLSQMVGLWRIDGSWRLNNLVKL